MNFYVLLSYIKKIRLASVFERTLKLCLYLYMFNPTIQAKKNQAAQVKRTFSPEIAHRLEVVDEGLLKICCPGFI